MSREHLVVGPPGTGKTTFLARQTQLAARKYGKDKILVASLTKAAANEVAGRDTGIFPDRIGTLHAHAYRAVGRPPIAESSQGMAQWNEYVDRKQLHKALEMEPGEGWIDPELGPAEARMRAIGMASGRVLLQEMGILRARMLPRDLWPALVRRFAENWDDFKAEKGLSDYTDLIEQALYTVANPPGNPSVMMLDEAQDLSKLEFALARKWAQTCEQSVTVGDPDQCLYSWRGTDPEAMTNQDFASRNVLSRSYRVPAAVHAYAMDWIERVDGREPVTYRPRLADPKRPDGPEAAGSVEWSRYTWRDCERLVTKIEVDVREHGHEVMVLATCTFMLDPILGVLRHRGLPFHNPYRPNHGGWNPMRGARRLLTFLQPDRLTHGPDAREWTWRDVWVWLAPLRSKGVLRRGAKTRVEQLAMQSTEESPNLVELKNLFTDGDAFERALKLDVRWWHEGLLGKDERVQRYPVRVYRERGGEALREKPRITVGTIHSVKGGQTDVVYVFPDLSKAGWIESWERRSSRAATYRQFYVAFTRAREKLVVCDAAGGYRVPFPKPESVLGG